MTEHLHSVLILRVLGKDLFSNAYREFFAFILRSMEITNPFITLSQLLCGNKLPHPSAHRDTEAHISREMIKLLLPYQAAWLPLGEAIPPYFPWTTQAETGHITFRVKNLHFSHQNQDFPLTTAPHSAEFLLQKNLGAWVIPEIMLNHFSNFVLINSHPQVFTPHALLGVISSYV